MAGYSRKLRAVAEVADCKPSELELNKWDHYGLELYSVGGGMEFAVGTDEEAGAAAAEYIKSSLWAFNHQFLADYTELPISIFKGLESAYEDANEAILTLVERTDGGLDELVAEAISSDGRGHFINGYDGNEHEVDIDGQTFYVYRVQ